MEAIGALAAILVAIIGGLFTVYTSRKNRQHVAELQEANRLAEEANKKAIADLKLSKADDIALERAKTLYESAIRTLEDHIVWLERNMAGLRERNHELELIVQDLQHKVRVLESQKGFIFPQQREENEERG